MRRIILFLGFTYFFTINLSAQKRYDSVSLASPLDIPLILAGNFAELRTNHFHTGIDIKTQGVEGKKIYAVEEGYISRIKYSHYGYGKVLYVTHPNGFTTVYAHLQKFADKIEEYARNIQYQNQSELYEVELTPDIFPIKKREVIALSGNTGSSMAPHLHFEIRDSKTEYALNPLLFNFHIEDNIKPTINGIKIYPINGSVNGKGEAMKYPVNGNNGSYTLQQTIEVNGDIGFAIHTIDKLNGAHNKCGAYKIELFVDDSLIVSQKLEQMDFEKNRYINAYKDYEEYHKNNFHYHRSFLLPNNTLKVYDKEQNRGIVSFNDGKMHNITYKVYDVYGNMSQLNFSVKNNLNLPINHSPIINKQSKINVDSTYILEDENYRVEISDSTFYDNESIAIHFENSLGKITIGNEYIPAQKYFALMMNAKNVPDSLKHKTIIAKLEKGKLKPKGGTLENGFIKTEVKELGTYSLMIDTIPPVVKELNFKDSVSFSGWMAFKFSVSDDISGIKSYNAFINNQWVLLQYVPQKDYMFIDYADLKHLDKGTHTLVIEIMDERKNLTKKVYAFTVN